MDFALGQFDVMTLLGAEVENIRETAKWRQRYSDGVVDAINGIRSIAEEHFEEETAELETDYWEQQREGYQGTQEEFIQFETQSTYNWINNDFLSFLEEQLDDERVSARFVEGGEFIYEEFEDNLGFTNRSKVFRNYN
jgi:hypothetical protein